MPAQVRYRALPLGERNEKFAALAAISLDGEGWAACPEEPQASFYPEAGSAWSEFAALDDLFVYSGSGVMPGRTWVVSPDPESLERRWQVLQAEKDIDRKEALFHPHLRGGRPGDKHVQKPLRQGLHGHEFREVPVASDEGAVVSPDISPEVGASAPGICESCFARTTCQVPKVGSDANGV